jgi:putative transposase
VFHDLARRKECRIEEGHLMPDHVHMLISIPPNIRWHRSSDT